MTTKKRVALIGRRIANGKHMSVLSKVADREMIVF